MARLPDLLLTPMDLLDDLDLLETPPRRHKHRFCGLLAPAAGALLLVRIYECLPLRCSRCGEPMRIIAFVLDRPTIERILDHIGEPTQPPVVLPARSPPQLAFGFNQTPTTTDWPEMDQAAGHTKGRGRIGAKAARIRRVD